MEASKDNPFRWSSPSFSAPSPEAENTSPGECPDMVLAMSYVKLQEWDEVYEPETSLERGTVFPALDFPFAGEGECPHDRA